MCAEHRDPEFVSLDASRTLLDVLAWRANRTPERSAYALLQDGESESAPLSYAELWRLARAWASEIQRRTEPGARVLLLLPTGLDFAAAFLGCLEAGRIAVPAYPPPPSRASRVRAIAADARPTLILTTRDAADATRRALADVDALAGCAWLGADDLDIACGDRWTRGPRDPDRPAFLQYTSGSTSAPRGVRVTHANLMHNQECIRLAFGLSADTTVVSWLPLFHDMGLVGTLLQPLYVGALGVLLPAAAFLQKPVRWLRAITRYRAHTSGGPNFAYDLCVRKVSPSDSGDLDLSSWTVAFNGAEPIQADTLVAFASRFAPHGFRAEAFTPCYGLAEATLMVSSRRTVALRRAAAAALERGTYQEAGDGEPARTLVSCGPPCLPGTYVVHPDTGRTVESGQVGELWLTGPCVAGGYWNQPDTTHEVFGARFAGHDGPCLRTGDLGLIHDGELFITGRLKDLIILRGANHYPQDIEATVQRSHPGLKAGGGAAFTADLDQTGEQQLVLVQEVEREALRRLDADAIGDAARDAVLQEHGLELAVLALVKPGGVPRTSSGKLQRNECRSRFLGSSLPLVADTRPLRAGGVWARLAALSAAHPEREVLRGGGRSIRLDELLTMSRDFARQLAGQGATSADSAVVPEPSASTLAAVLGASLASDSRGQSVLLRLPDRVLGDREIVAYADRLAERLYPEDEPTLVCAIERPDELAVLEWLGTLLAGGRVVFIPPPRARTAASAARQPGVSLLYFSANDAEFGEDKYRLFLDSARFADHHGFEAVWTPERHFHAFGGLYPNPSVLSAALAVTTDRIRLRAGSVVLPLHHPIRVVEEWAVVDNLSGGRVDLAFARGWNANDFVFAPDHFASSRDVLFRDLEVVRRLWRGETMAFENGHHRSTPVRVHPLPRQADLNVWITCSGGSERFAEAGAAGANVLTALLFQSTDELAAKVARYRRARADHGHDPDTGRVTLMLHTFVGDDMNAVRQAVREPFIDYLRTSVDLWRHGSQPLDQLSEVERRQLLEYAFERYLQTSALFGTPGACVARAQELVACGVDEIACLIDFGVPRDVALAGLVPLDGLRRALTESTSETTSRGHRLAAALHADGASALQCSADQLRDLAEARPGRSVPCLVQSPQIAGADRHALEHISIVDRRSLLDAGVPAGVPAVDRRERPALDERGLLQWLHGVARARIGAVVGLSPRLVSLDRSFSQLGVDSLKGIEIIAQLSEELNIELSPTLLFEFPTPARLSQHLVRTHAALLAAARDERRDVLPVRT